MLTLILAAAITAAPIHGTWSAVVDGEHVQLTTVRDHSDWSRTVPRSEFAVSDADMNSTTEKTVSFSMKRDPGSIDFTGTFENGEGVGRFAFTPNPAFAATLQSMGVSSDEPLDDEKLFHLAMMDVSTEFIREMQALGLRENLETYGRFRIHGVTPEFVREINALGYKPDAEGLVRFRIHGVTPDFIRDMRELGYDVSADDLVRFRIHGATPQFVRDLRDLGYKNLPAEDLVRFRIHGVTAQFVRELRDLGYSNLPAEDLVRFCIHGVTAEYIRELAGAGYHNIPADKLVEMRIHGIDAAWLRGTTNQ
ncbi:MAG TPA: hypothetical protein VL284_14125 [Thermoanaerobaculia bacterium]|nr:hypothetical protein [Thermoanaerobaculia bacterium]